MSRRPWQGWSSRAGAPRDEWTDLSRLLVNDMPKLRGFADPRFERVQHIADDGLNVTEIEMVVHVGTHVDAPCHLVPDGPSIDQVPIDRFHGRGVVWHIPDLEPYEVIDAGHLQAAVPLVEPDEIVLLSTGWAQHFGTSRYDEHPSLSPEAAQWLVDRRVKLIGLDTPTPDLSPERREPGFDWPVHQVLLSNGVLIGEHFDGLAPLAGQRVEVLLFPLRIAGADGAPVRALARPR